MGSAVSEVPYCVQTANIQNDPIAETDKLVLILCPLYSEADYVKRLLDLCTATNTPCILINPELINMDQGFGVSKYLNTRARTNIMTIINIYYSKYILHTNITSAYTHIYTYRGPPDSQ